MKKSIALAIALGTNVLIAQPTKYKIKLNYGELNGTHHSSIFRTKTQLDIGLLSYMPLHSGLYKMPYNIPMISVFLSTISLGIRLNYMPNENYMFDFQSFHGVNILSFYPDDVRGFFYADVRLGANYMFERNYRNKRVHINVSKEDYDEIRRSNPKVLGMSSFLNHHIFVESPSENYLGLRGGLDVITMPLEEILLQGVGSTLIAFYTGFMYGFQHDAILTLNNGNEYATFNSSYFYLDVQYAQANYSFAQDTDLKNNALGFRVGIRSFYTSDSRFSTQFELGKQAYLNDIFARISFCLQLK